MFNNFHSLIQFKKNIYSAKKCISNIEKTDIENYYADLELLIKISPNIKYKNLIIFEYYRGLILTNVLKNYEESIRLFTNIINQDNTFMPAMFSLWSIINKSNLGNEIQKNKLLVKLSYFMVKISLDEEVSSKDWIKTFIYYSKSLYYNEKNEQALQVLIAILDIFANIPLEDVKFLNEINKDNKISVTNVFVNFEHALKFFSKYHVYYKCEQIFAENYSKKNNDIFLNDIGEVNNNDLDINQFKNEFILESGPSVFNDYELQEEEEDQPSVLHNLNLEKQEVENENIENDNFHNKIIPKIVKNNSNLIYDPNFVDLSNESNFMENENNELKKVSDFRKVADLNIKTFCKLEEYIDNNINNFEINDDNLVCKYNLYFLVISIVSNPMVLYQIGKLCAKTKSKLELGLMCLTDFNLIIKFQYNYKLSSYNEKKRLKAKFWKGVIYLLLNNLK